jgi:hypothetical protein
VEEARLRDCVLGKQRRGGVGGGTESVAATVVVTANAHHGRRT